MLPEECIFGCGRDDLRMWMVLRMTGLEQPADDRRQALRMRMPFSSDADAMNLRTRMLDVDPQQLLPTLVSG